MGSSKGTFYGLTAELLRQDGQQHTPLGTGPTGHRQIRKELQVLPCHSRAQPHYVTERNPSNKSRWQEMLMARLEPKSQFLLAFAIHIKRLCIATALLFGLKYGQDVCFTRLYWLTFQNTFYSQAASFGRRHEEVQISSFQASQAQCQPWQRGEGPKYCYLRVLSQ